MYRLNAVLRRGRVLVDCEFKFLRARVVFSMPGIALPLCGLIVLVNFERVPHFLQVCLFDLSNSLVVFFYCWLHVSGGTQTTTFTVIYLVGCGVCQCSDFERICVVGKFVCVLHMTYNLICILFAFYVGAAHGLQRLICLVAEGLIHSVTGLYSCLDLVVSWVGLDSPIVYIGWSAMCFRDDFRLHFVVALTVVVQGCVVHCRLTRVFVFVARRGGLLSF
eukprot:gene2935-1917_t